MKHTNLSDFLVPLFPSRNINYIQWQKIDWIGQKLCTKVKRFDSWENVWTWFWILATCFLNGEFFFFFFFKAISLLLFLHQQCFGLVLKLCVYLGSIIIRTFFHFCDFTETLTSCCLALCSQFWCPHLLLAFQIVFLIFFPFLRLLLYLWWVICIVFNLYFIFRAILWGFFSVCIVLQ